MKTQKSQTKLDRSLFKKLRADKKLSQARAAKLIGFTTAQAISNLERGTAPIPATRVSKIAKVYGVKKENIIEYAVECFRVRYTKKAK